MLNVIDLYHQFLEQQIELYGDELVAPRIELDKQKFSKQQAPEFQARGDASANIWVLVDNVNNSDSEFELTSKAGDLFTKILAAIKLDIKDLYIISISSLNSIDVKDSIKEQVLQKIEFESPGFIICFGDHSSHLFFNSFDVKQNRDKVLDYKNIKVLATHHPQTLLENPKFKHDTWKDVQVLQKLYMNSKSSSI